MFSSARCAWRRASRSAASASAALDRVEDLVVLSMADSECWLERIALGLNQQERAGLRERKRQHPLVGGRAARPLPASTNSSLWKAS